MGLVEDQQVLSLVSNKLVGEEHGGFTPGSLGDDAGLAGEDVDEAEGADGAVGEIMYDPAVVLKFVREFAQQHAFAATGVGYQDGDAVEFDGEAEQTRRSTHCQAWISRLGSTEVDGIRLKRIFSALNLVR